MTNVCALESIYFPLSNQSVQFSPRSCIMRAMNNHLLFTFSIKFINAWVCLFFPLLFSTKLILNGRTFIPLLLLSVFSVLWLSCGTADTGIPHTLMGNGLCVVL